MSTSIKKINRELKNTSVYNPGYDNFNIFSSEHLEILKKLNLSLEEKEGYTHFGCFVVGFTGGTGATSEDKTSRPERQDVYYKGNLVMFCQEDIDLGLTTLEYIQEKLEKLSNSLKNKPNDRIEKELKGYKNNFPNI